MIASLPIYILICLSIYIYIYIYICGSLSLSLSLTSNIYLPMKLSICVYDRVSVYLSIYPSIDLSVCLSICLSVSLSGFLHTYIISALIQVINTCISVNIIQSGSVVNLMSTEGDTWRWSHSGSMVLPSQTPTFMTSHVTSLILLPPNQFYSS